MTGPGVGDDERLYFYGTNGALVAVIDITYTGETCVAGPATFTFPGRCNDPGASAECCDVVADMDLICTVDAGRD